MSEAVTTPSPFVHLRVHSEFSVVDGIVRIPDLIKRVAKLGQPAVALTDLSNLFGLIKFYKGARGAGIKPIAGCDVWLSNDDDPAKPFRVLLLVRNHQGYLNLCELLSRAFLTNQGKGRAEIRREWLQGQDGLIVLSGGRGGDVGQALDAGNAVSALALARQWAHMFPGSYYIELQRAGMDGDEAYTQAAMRLAAEAGLPVVATHPVQFLDEYEFQAHEARVCIAEGEILANPRRVRRFSKEQYLLSSEEMARRFADVPSALANTVEIAKRCNLSLVLGKPRLPNFPTPDGVSLDDYLVQLSEEGLEKRMAFLFPDEAERASKREQYYERLRWECKTIIQMGFPGYFLIVQDFINWGKNNGVPVGPGRGSGAGSLVAYALGITDSCQDNRERVIDYVKEKYGRAAVSQIATFGTLGAKAVVRDAGRVLDMPYMFCDGLSKLIPFNPMDPWTLERTLKDEPAFKDRYEQEEEVRALVDLAKPLEGLTRNIGMHAGGVLIAPGKLTDFCPLYCQPGQENSAVSQFDKDDVEAAGLVKFDFLGLRNLTILDWAVPYVRQFNEDKRDFDVMAPSLDDPAAYKILCDANTTAVFQLESRGMKELLKKLRPNTFEDIIAMLALYRPGPLESGMVDDFVNRKHGRAAVDYFHNDLESTLKSTYGVIVYQEQVMLISQIIGGYSLGGADLLRRAMGKKKPEEMAKHRELFEKGAKEKGHDPDLAVKLFDLMEKFAGYGFNKSHSAAYPLISYQTAWLKAYHPTEFLAATMSSDMDDTDKVQIFCRDAQDNGVEVLPPDVNFSGYRFEPVADKHTEKGKPPRTMRYGLGAVKGTGQGAVEDILRARKEGGPFQNLFDFCRRVSKHAVNRRTIEALIKAGAFDTIEPNRAAMLASVPTAMEAAEQAARSANQSSLFGDDSSDVVAGELAKAAPWDLHKKLTEEKSALGYYYSGHLFDAWRDEVRQIVPMQLARVEPQRDLQWMCGVLASVRVMMTRRGKMVFAVLDDGTAQVEISVFNELYEKHRNRLREDQLVIVQGKVSNDDYSGGMRIVAEQLYDLQLAREARAKSLRVKLNGGADAARLRQMLNPFRAEPENGIPGVPVDIVYTKNNFLCTVRLGEEWRVRMADTLLENLNAWTKPNGVEVTY
jgi:DNA polymerase-3 subunit alpha